MQTGKGYRPSDLISSFGKGRIAVNYFRKKLFSNIKKDSFCVMEAFKTNKQKLLNPDRFNIIKSNRTSNEIIYSGRLASGKNLFKWLECAKSILTTFPDATFSLFGEGPLKERLKKYSIRLGISEKVTFHGFEKNIENAYKQADLLLFLSEYESFGNVVIESILCGTPVVVSDIPSMKEIFENFPEFLVPLDKNIENNVLKKIENLSELKKSASRAAKEFQTRFSLTQHIKQFEIIYKDLK